MIRRSDEATCRARRYRYRFYADDGDAGADAVRHDQTEPADTASHEAVCGGQADAYAHPGPYAHSNAVCGAVSAGHLETPYVGDGDRAIHGDRAENYLRQPKIITVFDTVTYGEPKP